MPCERSGANDCKARILYGGIMKNREMMEKGLSGEQKEQLADFGQRWEDYLLRMMELAFREGVSPGLRLGAEAFSSR